MRITLSPSSIEDYKTFLAIKRLPKYRFIGRTAEFPDEYAKILGVKVPVAKSINEYTPSSFLFDYQRDISRMAIRKRKFAGFIRCGLGKTLINLEFSVHARKHIGDKNVLMISPLMVVDQTIEEAKRFYGSSFPIEQVTAKNLDDFVRSGGNRLGITNYDSLHSELIQGNIGAMVCDESSVWKSFGGKWGQTCLRLGKGLEWKMAATGTPAPNDRIEFANHAVFMDAFPNVNSFLSRYFVNKGQTQNRWELKKHAVGAFYRDMSYWSIFLNSPATYGWKDNTDTIPPVHVHIDDIDLTSEQRDLVQLATGTMFGNDSGGIVSRSVLSQIAKGNHRGNSVATNKPDFIKRMVESWPNESTIIWCLYNPEQALMEKTFPDAASMKGDTPYPIRKKMIDDFKSGRKRVMIAKGKVLGWGLNLENCTRMVFSGLQDSWEMYHQCVSRANRVGAKTPLNIHIPITSVERRMVDTILTKAHRIELDTIEQEKTFKEMANEYLA